MSHPSKRAVRDFARKVLNSGPTIQMFMTTVRVLRKDGSFVEHFDSNFYTHEHWKYGITVVVVEGNSRGYHTEFDTNGKFCNISFNSAKGALVIESKTDDYIFEIIP